MIHCTIGDKKYSINFVSGRALREIEEATKMYAKITKASQDAMDGKEVKEDETTIADALDVLVKWFCLLFNNQFTPDELYDGYPADRLVPDIIFALLAVQSQTTEVLSNFPTNPTTKVTQETKD